MKSALLFLLALTFTHSALAETIEFPQEELATESVLPVFDNPLSVRNRNVQTAKRFEIGPHVGSHLSEPFYEQMNFGATATYHMDETHGVNLFASVFSDGLQAAGSSLKNISGTTDKINLEYGPHTEWIAMVSYQHNAFYGKLSITKEAVMNLSIYGLAGLGGVNIGGTTFPGATVGIGQKFYFSKQLALRMDMRFLFHQGPDIVGGSSNPLRNATTPQAVDAFEKRLFIGSLLSGGVIWLIPNS